MAQPFVEPSCSGVIDAEPCPREEKRELPRSRRAIALTACILASSMAFIDGSALTVALPQLRAALGADLAAVQWVINGYVLALASLTLIGGAMADTYGKARILAIGCILFAAASAACALAPSAVWLIAARIVQGVGAALLTPTSLALIGAVYPKEERNRAIGVWAAASALTTAGGPVLGGWLVQHFGWQAVFWINPPIAVVVLVLLRVSAPSDVPAPRRFDVLGAALIAGALAALAWALGEIGRVGDEGAAAWPPIVVAVLFSLIGLVVFARWENRSADPMTPPRLAANRPFMGLNLATLAIYAALALMFFLLPFDLIDRRGMPAMDAGATFIPFTLGVGLLSRPFGAAADALGARLMMIIGPILAALAYIWMALGSEASLVWGVIAPMTLLGIAFAVLIAPLTAAVLSSVSADDHGLASGLNNAASRVAQLAGVAVAAGIGSLAAGYALGLAGAAVLSLIGAAIIALTMPAPAKPPRR